MQIKILRFAQQLEHRSVLRHVFYLAAALACIMLIGYHFGTFDQVVHIPFLKTWANPTLYPTDPFLDLRQAWFRGILAIVAGGAFSVNLPVFLGDLGFVADLI